MKACTAILALAVAFPAVGWAQEFNLSPTFAGRAIALQAMETDQSPVALVDTGPVPLAGGVRQTSLADAVAYPGVIARQLYALTTAFINQNQSQASMAGLDFSIGNHRVAALWTEAQATARAEFLTVATSGSVTVQSLTIDGNPVTVSGAANQTINLPDGYVVINEQTGSSSRDYGVITVNAIHIVVNGVGSIVAASATAEVINRPTR
jgi:hypothetical protein